MSARGRGGRGRGRGASGRASESAHTQYAAEEKGQASGAKRGRGRGKPQDSFMDSLDALTARLTDKTQYDSIEVGGHSVVDFTSLTLKPDHEKRPFWVTPTGSIYLEATSPLYDQARDFLVAICEPVSRPEHVHEWRLDRHALFAAASMGLSAELILAALNRLSKVPISQTIAEFITVNTSGYGKVKLVLERGRYFIESAYPALLRLLNKHPTIRAARVRYAADGTRLVGAQGLAAASAAARSKLAPRLPGMAGMRGGEEGFEVANALAETASSLGLQGLLGPGEVGAAADAGAAARMGDTAGGTLAARIVGEVDSEEEGEVAAVEGGSAAVAAAASHVLERGDAATATASTGSSILAELADDFSKLDAEDLEQLLDAVTQAETAFEAEEQAKRAVDDAVIGRASGGPQGAAGATSLAADGSTMARPAMRNKLSFRDDIVKTVSAELPKGDGGVNVEHTIVAAAVAEAAAEQDGDMLDGGDYTSRLRPNRSYARPGEVDTMVAEDVTIVKTEGAKVEQAQETTITSEAADGSRVVKRPRLVLGTGLPPPVTEAQAETASPAAASAPSGAPKLRLRLGGKSSAAASAGSDTAAAAVGVSVVAAVVEVDAKPAPSPLTSVAASLGAREPTTVASSEVSMQSVAEERRQLVRFAPTAADEVEDTFGDAGDEDDEFGPGDSDEDEEYLDAEDEDAMEEEDGGARRRRKKRAPMGTGTKQATDVWAGRAKKPTDMEKQKVSDMAEFNEMLKGLSMNLLHTPGRVERFEVDTARVEDIKWVCLHLVPPLPMMQEYDFRHDTMLPSLEISLRNPGQLRYYQERSLSKMFGNGRARSGIIVLPCGAGKTLVGIASASTMAKSTIVLCPNQTSVAQWVEQFKRYSTIQDRSICVLTAKHKQALPPLHEAVLLLTTYSMIGSGGRGAESAEVLRAINEREWGLMLLDEVHQAVADTFRRVLKLRAHCRLGLTATLVREDGRDKALSHLIGPKLYEANWLDLTRGDYLANVQVAEVWCPMSPEFYREYLRASSLNVRKALSVMNPNKCVVMEYLLKHHEALGHKIIVFSESVFALEVYAKQFNCIAIYGDTPPLDRETFIRGFKMPNGGINKLFLSRVGDVALDVPDANVIIQISSHFGSRLQEAQRMGRILRRGDKEKGTPRQSFFYTLISGDTMETYFANKRRRYLVDQGYAYKVIPSDSLVEGGLDELRGRATFLSTDEDRMRMLERVLRENIDELEGRESKHFASLASVDAVSREAVDTRAALRASGVGIGTTAAAAGSATPAAGAPPPVARRILGGMSALSGGEGLRYVEYSTTNTSYAALKAEEEARAAERKAAAAAARVGPPKRNPDAGAAGSV